LAGDQAREAPPAGPRNREGTQQAETTHKMAKEQENHTEWTAQGG